MDRTEPREIRSPPPFRPHGFHSKDHAQPSHRVNTSVSPRRDEAPARPLAPGEFHGALRRLWLDRWTSIADSIMWRIRWVRVPERSGPVVRNSLRGSTDMQLRYPCGGGVSRRGFLGASAASVPVISGVPVLGAPQGSQESG